MDGVIKTLARACPIASNVNFKKFVKQLHPLRCLECQASSSALASKTWKDRVKHRQPFRRASFNPSLGDRYYSFRKPTIQKQEFPFDTAIISTPYTSRIVVLCSTPGVNSEDTRSNESLQMKIEVMATAFYRW